MKVFSHFFLGTSEKKSIHEYIEKIQQYYLLQTIRIKITYMMFMFQGSGRGGGGLRPLGYCLIFINGLVFIRPYDFFTQVLAISHSMSSETDSGGRGGRQHWCSSSSVTNRVHHLSVWVTSKDILAYSNGKRNDIYTSSQRHKGPRTLRLKLQKIRYCPYTLQLFFTTATIFQQFDIWGTIFIRIFLKKSL